MTAPVIVQKWQTMDTAETATALTLALTGLTVGNGLVVFLGTRDNNPGNDTLSLSGASPPTWSVRITSYPTGNFGLATLTATLSVTGGNLTLTCTKSGSSQADLSVYEVTLPNGEAPDGTAVTATGTGTVATVAMNATSQTDLLLQGIVSRESAQVTFGTIQTGWTQDQTQSVAGPSSFSQTATGSYANAAAGSYTAGWPTMTNANSREWIIQAIAIKGSADSDTLLAQSVF